MSEEEEEMFDELSEEEFAEELRATVERMPESAAAHSNYGAGLKGAGQVREVVSGSALGVFRHFFS